uniref:Large ribosomal subunit protein uL2 C-terminal domain-containing protein n=1 Tax=Solanum lycopersicum TaxID=4081 RepID=A0A3Q7EX22_SOLLC
MQKEFFTAMHRGDIDGRIVTIEYDPNQNAFISLIHYKDGAIIGDTIVSCTQVPIKIRNVVPLSAGSGCCRETDSKRGEMGKIKITYWVGPFDIKKQLSNSQTSGECLGELENFGAISKCWLGKRPVVRGVVMNPTIPMGGGDGRALICRNHNPLGLSSTWKMKLKKE